VKQLPQAVETKAGNKMNSLDKKIWFSTKKLILGTNQKKINSKEN